MENLRQKQRQFIMKRRQEKLKQKKQALKNLQMKQLTQFDFIRQSIFLVRTDYILFLANTIIRQSATYVTPSLQDQFWLLQYTQQLPLGPMRHHLCALILALKIRFKQHFQIITSAWESIDLIEYILFFSKSNYLKDLRHQWFLVVLIEKAKKSEISYRYHYMCLFLELAVGLDSQEKREIMPVINESLTAGGEHLHQKAAELALTFALQECELVQEMIDINRVAELALDIDNWRCSNHCFAILFKILHNNETDDIDSTFPLDSFVKCLLDRLKSPLQIVDLKETWSAICLLISFNIPPLTIIQLIINIQNYYEKKVIVMQLEDILVKTLSVVVEQKLQHEDIVEYLIRHANLDKILIKGLNVQHAREEYLGCILGMAIVLFKDERFWRVKRKVVESGALEKLENVRFYECKGLEGMAKQLIKIYKKQQGQSVMEIEAQAYNQEISAAYRNQQRQRLRLQRLQRKKKIEEEQEQDPDLYSFEIVMEWPSRHPKI